MTNDNRYWAIRKEYLGALITAAVIFHRSFLLDDQDDTVSALNTSDAPVIAEVTHDDTTISSAIEEVPANLIVSLLPTKNVNLNKPSVISYKKIQKILKSIPDLVLNEIDALVSKDNAELVLSNQNIVSMTESCHSGRRVLLCLDHVERRIIYTLGVRSFDCLREGSFLSYLITVYGTIVDDIFSKLIPSLQFTNSRNEYYKSNSEDLKSLDVLTNKTAAIEPKDLMNSIIDILMVYSDNIDPISFLSHVEERIVLNYQVNKFSDLTDGVTFLIYLRENMVFDSSMEDEMQTLEPGKDNESIGILNIKLHLSQVMNNIMKNRSNNNCLSFDNSDDQYINNENCLNNQYHDSEEIIVDHNSLSLEDVFKNKKLIDYYSRLPPSSVVAALYTYICYSVGNCNTQDNNGKETADSKVTVKQYLQFAMEVLFHIPPMISPFIVDNVISDCLIIEEPTTPYQHSNDSEQIFSSSSSSSSSSSPIHYEYHDGITIPKSTPLLVFGICSSRAENVQLLHPLLSNGLQYLSSSQYSSTDSYSNDNLLKRAINRLSRTPIGISCRQFTLWTEIFSFAYQQQLNNVENGNITSLIGIIAENQEYLRECRPDVSYVVCINTDDCIPLLNQLSSEKLEKYFNDYQNHLQVIASICLSASLNLIDKENILDQMKLFFLIQAEKGGLSDENKLNFLLRICINFVLAINFPEYYQNILAICFEVVASICMTTPDVMQQGVIEMMKDDKQYTEGYKYPNFQDQLSTMIIVVGIRYPYSYYIFSECAGNLLDQSIPFPPNSNGDSNNIYNIDASLPEIGSNSKNTIHTPEDLEQTPSSIKESSSRLFNTGFTTTSLEVFQTTSFSSSSIPHEEDMIPTTMDKLSSDDISPTVTATKSDKNSTHSKDFITKLLVEEFMYEEGGLKPPKSSVTQEKLKKTLDALSVNLYSEDTHFMMELIQNADDNSYSNGQKPSLMIQIYPHVVVVYNNEIGFSDSNIRAICDVAKSTKVLQKGYIGQKGIG